MNGPNCWNCDHHQKSGATLLGFCRWFVVMRKGGAREIPPSVIDKGCQFFERKRAYPMTPHFHTCRTCPERHRWTCLSPRCTWALMLDCAAGRTFAAQNTGRPT